MCPMAMLVYLYINNMFYTSFQPNSFELNGHIFRVFRELGGGEGARVSLSFSVCLSKWGLKRKNAVV